MTSSKVTLSPIKDATVFCVIT